MTPIRINLLPHRQLRKARQQRWFAILAAIVVGLGLATVAAGQAYLVNAKSNQDARNAFPQGRNRQTGQADCRNRRTERERPTILLERKKVVESLQNNRGEAV
jgi:type IV pilus assembly protein PilN